MKIMLIEDNATILDELSALLRAASCTVISCASAEEALNSFLDGAPEVVIADAGLPGISGGEFIRFVAKVSPKTAFFMISGSAERLEIEAQKSGNAPLATLSKPVKPDELKSLLGLRDAG